MLDNKPIKARVAMLDRNHIKSRDANLDRKPIEASAANLDRKPIKARAAIFDLPGWHNTNKLSPNPEYISELGSCYCINIVLNING